MKRAIALLFVIMMMTVQICAAAPASEDSSIPAGTDVPAAAPEEQPAEPDMEHLSVGNPTELKGEFFTDLWGNSTTDQDVRRLLHAYNLIIWNGVNGMFTYDPSVVNKLVTVDNAAGDRTYTFTLADDLYYSDGTKITAWDYAFSFLLQIAPELEDLGAAPARKPQLSGYQDYMEGKAACLAGVRVMADNTLAVTVDHSYLPFFYELALVSIQPYPAGVIAPGVEVRDDGAGVYLANIDDTVREPLFTSSLLRETIMDPQTGYMSHPSVISGPYILTSWDGETAEFEINDYYKGNSKGELPRIRTLTFQTADNASMIKEFREGTYDLLNKVMNKDTIDEGMMLVADEELGKYYSMSNYQRSGMGFITFTCDTPALSEKAVRQAIAWCMDRDRIMTDYTGYYGTRVDGYYGVGQWPYKLVDGSMLPPVKAPADKNDAAAMAEYEKRIAEYKKLSLKDLTVYKVDTDKAAAILEGAGWKLNEEGIREKSVMLNAGKEDPRSGAQEQMATLELTMIYPEGSPIAESFEKNFIPNLEKVGIRLELIPVPFADLLTQYYYPEYREADMIFLASNFEEVFDPSTYFRTETDEATGREIHTWITTGCADEELYNIAVAMRKTVPGDVLTYCQKWISFQKRFNEVLPMLPIYSNTYFDFYISNLQNYAADTNISWADAIVSAFIR